MSNTEQQWDIRLKNSLNLEPEEMGREWERLLAERNAESHQKLAASLSAIMKEHPDKFPKQRKLRSAIICGILAGVVLAVAIHSLSWHTALVIGVLLLTASLFFKHKS